MAPGRQYFGQNSQLDLHRLEHLHVMSTADCWRPHVAHRRWKVQKYLRLNNAAKPANVKPRK